MLFTRIYLIICLKKKTNKILYRDEKQYDYVIQAKLMFPSLLIGIRILLNAILFLILKLITLLVNYVKMRQLGN